MKKEIKEITDAKVEKDEVSQSVVSNNNTALFIISITVSLLLGASIMALCGPLFMRGHCETFQRRSGLVVINQQYGHGPQMMTRRLF